MASRPRSARPIRSAPRRGARRWAQFIRGEYAGGILLLAGTALALLWANSPWAEGYRLLQELRVGPEALHLDLSLRAWAADGLLAVFFFVVGLELKRELTTGALSSLRGALVPVVAAIGGMVVPAAIYLGLNLGLPGGAPQGWAIPVATDIAFALAMLGVFAPGIPPSVRAFLLALAVTDDLLGITIIAVFYAEGLSLLWLVAAGALLVLFAVLTRRGITAWWLLLPIGVATWYCMHESGVHATVAGVLLGLLVPAVGSTRDGESMVERFERRWSPVSVGVAIPVFAFLATGVTVSGELLGLAVTTPVGLGITLGLVLGKPLGILLFTSAAERAVRVPRRQRLLLGELLLVGGFAGIGLTVSVLVAELAFRDDALLREEAVLAILLASVLATLFGAVAARVSRRRVPDVPRPASGSARTGASGLRRLIGRVRAGRAAPPGIVTQ